MPRSSSTRRWSWFVHAARAVEADGIIADALESGLADDPVVYNRFLELTGSIRGSACIELYDAL